MYNDSSTPPEHGAIHGMPARTPAPAALWAHLLRKEPLPPAPDSGIVLPPITPLDKNGTSMRILLHDTQAHLDKFAAKVDGLCKSIDNTKQEISVVHSLFQREHETLTTELVDLVNRSQTQIQAAIGSPAQAEESTRQSKDLANRLESLDKRIDAIQSFNQTHSQTLQLQSQALQSLQDQQGKLITAVMPLLPLLQALPLHIESARNTITDHMSKSHKSPLRSPATLHSDNRRRSHKRSSSNPIPYRSPSLPSKKAKISAETGPSGRLISLNKSDAGGGLNTPPCPQSNFNTINRPGGVTVFPGFITNSLLASKQEIAAGQVVELTNSIHTEEATESFTPSRSLNYRIVFPGLKTTSTVSPTNHPAEWHVGNSKILSPTPTVMRDCNKESSSNFRVVELVSQAANDNHLVTSGFKDPPLSRTRSSSIARLVLSKPSLGSNAASTSVFPCINEQGLPISPKKTPKKLHSQSLNTLTSTAQSSPKIKSTKTLAPQLAKDNIVLAKKNRRINNQPLVITQPLSRAPPYPGNIDSTRQPTNQLSEQRGPQALNLKSLQSSHPYSATVAKQTSIQTPRRVIKMTPTMNIRERSWHVQREGRRFIPLSDSDDDDDDCDENRNGAASYGA